VTTYHGHGLQINTLADIFINNTDAVNNMLFGGQLTAAGEVAISNSSFSDTSTGNDASVAEWNWPGDRQHRKYLACGNVVLNNNQSVGADIDAGGDVFLIL
jgi:hypothetical protein